MPSTLRVGAYPFASTGSIPQNLSKICGAIRQAAAEQVRLLVFHECALCGYPPIETQMERISPGEIEAALLQIGALTRECRLYAAVGTVRFEGQKRYNSLFLFDDTGRQIGCYDKKALWGWDSENFSPGSQPGLFCIDGFRVGFRICFDVRFPEPFRELYREGVDLCAVSFSDTQKEPSPARYQTIKSHLVTRAMENIMSVVSVNSLSAFQTAPTAFFDWNGSVLRESELDSERLLIYDVEKPDITFGVKGRVVNNDFFIAQEKDTEKRDNYVSASSGIPGNHEKTF